MTTLRRLIRTREIVDGKVFKRPEMLPALDREVAPCLNCGGDLLRDHGQIVRFCSKECRREYKRAMHKEIKRNRK